jgi:hypothetical protein
MHHYREEDTVHYRERDRFPHQEEDRSPHQEENTVHHRTAGIRKDPIRCRMEDNLQMVCTGQVDSLQVGDMDHPVGDNRQEETALQEDTVLQEDMVDRDYWLDRKVRNLFRTSGGCIRECHDRAYHQVRIS